MLTFASGAQGIDKATINALGKKVASFLGVGIASYCGLRCISIPEKFEPSLENLAIRTITPLNSSSTTTAIHDYMESMGNNQCEQSEEVIISTRKKCFVRSDMGIDLTHTYPQEPVFVFSPYFLPVLVKHPKKFLFFSPSAAGRSLYAAGYYLSNKAIPSTCVTFNFRDTRKGINVAQELDQHCLKMVTDEVVRQHHGFVLFGVCRGSMNILNFLTQQPKEYLQENLKGVIIDAAPFSLKDISEQTMRALPVLNWMPHRAGSKLLYAFFRALMPNHRYQESDILEHIDNIPQDLPILIIHVKGDTVAYDGNIKLLLQKLLETNHTNVHCLLLDNKELNHYTMSTAPVYPQATNAFLQKYKLPHNVSLAEIGNKVMPSFSMPLVPCDKTAEQYIEDFWKYSAVNADGFQLIKNQFRSIPA